MIVVDTDVWIDFLYGVEPASTFLAKLREEGQILAMTSINVAELMRGAHGNPRRVARVSAIVAAFQQVPFGPSAARRFGELMSTLDRAGATIDVADGLIAAATLEAGGRLVTRNARDFGRVPGLEVLTPR